MRQFDPIKTRIFEGIIGSNLYGTATKDSDVDYRGICLVPMEVILNPFESFEQKDSGFEEEDRCIYSLSKFFKLCSDANPNLLEILFIPENKTVFTTNLWDIVLENKHLFISKKAKYTFLGYSWTQLTKAKVHREWFLNPPKEKPTREMFDLTDSPIISGEGLQAVSNIKFDVFKDEFVKIIKDELDYRNAKKRWDDFISWRDNRNPARRQLEEKFGYDTKSILHVFRLLEEGKQILLTGEIKFPLENAEELLEIKNGKYTYDEAIEKASSLEKQFETWYEQSSLPKSPDRNALTELYLRIVFNK